MDKPTESFIVYHLPRNIKTVNHFTMPWKMIFQIVLVIVLSYVMFGCATMQPNTGYHQQQPKASSAVKTAGAGALLGGIVHAIKGGDTQEGLAIVGGSALIGYLFGNEKDKSASNMRYQSQKRTNQYQREYQYNNKHYGLDAKRNRYANETGTRYESYSKYDDGQPKTKWRKVIKRVTKNGETVETINETGVSTKTEDVYYE